MKKCFSIFLLVLPILTNAQKIPIVEERDSLEYAENITSRIDEFTIETKFHTSSFKLTSYDLIQFPKPRFTEHFEPSLQYKPVNAFDVSSSIMLNHPTTENLFSRMRKPDPLKTKDDYKDKSKRQKTTGMVLLITGMALVTTSVVIANHQDGLTGAATFVYVGGPGFILSLASIPFLVSSAHNKSKWMNYQ